jgi:hypothetical protein
VPGIIGSTRWDRSRAWTWDFLVDAEYDSLLGRVVVEPDDVDDLVDELRIGGELEAVLQVGLETEVLPDPTNGRFRQPAALGHRRPRPVRVPTHLRAWYGLQRRDDHVLDLVERDRGRPAGAGLVLQSVQAVLGESGAPALHGRDVHGELGGDLLVGPAIGGPQHDLRSQGQVLGGLRPLRPPLQLQSFLRRQHQRRLRSPHRPGILQAGQSLTGELRPPPARRPQRHPNCPRHLWV